MAGPLPLLQRVTSTDSAPGHVADAVGQSERSESRTNFLQGSVVFRLCNQEASLSAPRRRILKPDCELESAGGLFLSSFQTSNPWTHPGRVTVPLVVWRCSSATCICMDLSWRILMRKPVWEICCRPPPSPLTFSPYREPRHPLTLYLVMSSSSPLSGGFSADRQAEVSPKYF